MNHPILPVCDYNIRTYLIVNGIAFPDTIICRIHPVYHNELEGNVMIAGTWQDEHKTWHIATLNVPDDVFGYSPSFVDSRLDDPTLIYASEHAWQATDHKPVRTLDYVVKHGLLQNGSENF